MNGATVNAPPQLDGIVIEDVGDGYWVMSARGEILSRHNGLNPWEPALTDAKRRAGPGLAIWARSKDSVRKIQ